MNPLFWMSRNKDVAIGGVVVGSSGATGSIYEGYTLAGGDDFTGTLDIFRPANPSAKYLQTHCYYPGSRSVSGFLQNSYDSDPYHTGSQDSNRGEPVTTDTLVQSASVLSIKARSASAEELPYINGRKIVSGMICTGPHVTFCAPCIVEAAIQTNVTAAQAPLVWHPTFWLQSSSPLDSYNAAPSPGGQEYDFPEIYQNDPKFNFNKHGTVPGSGTSVGSISNTFMGDGEFHDFSLVMGATDVKGYQDGTLKGTITQDPAISLRPYQALLTNHTYQDSAINLTTWDALGDTGAVLLVDYFRAWLPTASKNNIVRPTQSLPVQQVDFNTAFSYTFPEAASLWNKTVTSDYCQAIRFEEFEPGSTTEGTTGYLRFPAELTWDEGTRTLSGSVTSRPGRLHLGVFPYLASSIGYTARGYIDVGPNITTTQINGVVDSPLSYDLYEDCDCGTLLPKTITCTGLPAGLSFSPSTGLITGTPTGESTTQITISVTNSSGQSVDKNINVVSLTSGNLAIDGFASATGTGTTINVSLATSSTNDILCVLVKSGPLAGDTVSVTDNGPGLTWTKHAGTAYLDSGSEEHKLELWYAVSPLVFNSTITVTSTNSVDSPGRMTAFGISGADTTTPFDTNVLLPNVNSPGSVESLPPSTPISTTAVDTMLLAFAGFNKSFTGRPSGFTSIGYAGGATALSYQIVTSAQTLISPTYTCSPQTCCGIWTAVRKSP